MGTVELKKLNPLFVNAFGDEDDDTTGTDDQNLEEKELGANMDEEDLDLDSLDNEFIEESDEEGL